LHEYFPRFKLVANTFTASLASPDTFVFGEITTENNRSVTVTAEVEEMNGYAMQLRILGTEGQTVYLNEMMLYVGTTLWDGYSEWYSCQF